MIGMMARCSRSVACEARRKAFGALGSSQGSAPVVLAGVGTATPAPATIPAWDAERHPPHTRLCGPPAIIPIIHPIHPIIRLALQAYSFDLCASPQAQHIKNIKRMEMNKMKVASEERMNGERTETQTNQNASPRNRSAFATTGIDIAYKA